MAGKKRTRDMLARLDDNVDDILEAIAKGDMIQTIANRYRVSRRTFYLWTNQDPKTKAAFREARRQSADSLVEQAGKILDKSAKDANMTTAQAGLNRERANHRRWLAGKFSEDYSEGRPSVEVNISLGQLHLDALRAGGGMPAPALEGSDATPEEIQEADYSVLPAAKEGSTSESA